MRANWRRVMMGWLPLAGALVGCSPAPPEGALPPSDPQRCVAPEELDGEAVPARELALGEGDPTTFEPYSEGETVALQLGWQGGFMITPRLRVQALPGDPDSNCWQLRLNNEMDDPAAEVAPGVVAQLLFERHGDVYYSDPVNNLLSYEAEALRGKALLLEVSASGVGVDEATAVSVVLE